MNFKVIGKSFLFGCLISISSIGYSMDLGEGLKMSLLKSCYKPNEKIIVEIRNETMQEIMVNGTLEIFLNGQWQEIESSIFQLLPRSKGFSFKRLSSKSRIAAKITPSSLFYFSDSRFGSENNKYKVRIEFIDEKGAFKKVEFADKIFTVLKKCT